MHQKRRVVALRNLLILAAIILLFSVVILKAQTPPDTPGPAAKTTTPTPAPETKDPSPDWLKSYDGAMDLQRVIAQQKADAGIDKLEEALQKKVNGLAVQIPAGFTFDPNKRKFVKPADAPAATPPVPAKSTKPGGTGAVNSDSSKNLKAPN